MQQGQPEKPTAVPSVESSWVGLMVTATSLVSLTLVTVPFLRRYSGAPYVTSSSTAQQSIRNFLQIHFRKLHCRSSQTTHRPRMVDLGSGSGEHVISAAKIGYDAVGVERNVWLLLYSRLRARRMGVDARFVWGDLWKIDCKDFDVVVVFGIPAIMQRVGDKLKRECAEGCIVCSHMFDIPEWTCMRHEGAVRYYQIGKQSERSS